MLWRVEHQSLRLRGTEKAPASHPVLETPAVAKAPRSASRQKPQARASLVSAARLSNSIAPTQTAGSTIRFSQAREDDLRKPR
jgi:hypothetical protein